MKSVDYFWHIIVANVNIPIWADCQYCLAVDGLTLISADSAWVAGGGSLLAVCLRTMAVEVQISKMSLFIFSKQKQK